jgi:hypothetical protein
MLRSKHSGWTWEGKRTPFGGGGFLGIGDAVAGLDPHITEGTNDWMAQNGWMIPVAMITAGAGLAAAGGEVAGGGLTAAGGEVAADGTVFAAGETIPAGTAMADGSVVGSSGLTSTEIANSGGLIPTEGSSFAVDPNAAYTTGTNATGASATTATPGASSILSQPDVTVNLGATNGGTVGSLNPALPAVGAPEGTSIGMSSQLAPGTVMGNGLTGGGAIGSTYAIGADGLPATDFFGNYIPASSINTGGVPSTIAGTTGTSTNSDLLKLLKQGAGSGLSKSLGQLAQGANPKGQELGQLVRSNQSPFTYTPQQPIQDTMQAKLASLLKQG